MFKAGSRIVVAIVPEESSVGKSADTKTLTDREGRFDARAASDTAEKNLKEDDDAYPY